MEAIVTQFWSTVPTFAWRDIRNLSDLMSRSEFEPGTASYKTTVSAWTNLEGHFYLPSPVIFIWQIHDTCSQIRSNLCTLPMSVPFIIKHHIMWNRSAKFWGNAEGFKTIGAAPSAVKWLKCEQSFIDNIVFSDIYLYRTWSTLVVMVF